MSQAACSADLSLSHTAAPVKSRGFWLLIALLALVGVGKAIQSDTMDPDAFWHLRVADQLRTDGIGPLVDQISFASLKVPWTPYSWLAELFMSAVWAIGGFRLASAVTALCSAGIIFLIAAAARVHTQGRNDLAVALLTAVAAFFTLPFISFRPVTFALLVMAVIVLLLARDQRHASWHVWLIVPLMLVLTNLHLYAVVIVSLVWATAVGAFFDDCARLRSRLILAIATTVAACCTPMLKGAVATALSYNGTDPMVASPFITEMRPFWNGFAGKVSFILFTALIAVCIWKRKMLSITDWLWLMLGTVLLFRLGRFSPVFAMLAMPILGKASPKLGGRALGKPIVQLALVVVLIAGITNVLPSLGENDFSKWLNRHNATYPTDAAQFVEKNVSPRQLRLINEFNWGGYLAWRLGEQYQVMMDGRTQLYSPDFWLRTHLGDEASRLAIMRETQADAAVLPAHGSCFSNALAQLGWREAYRDELAIVMVP